MPITQVCTFHRSISQNDHTSVEAWVDQVRKVTSTSIVSLISQTTWDRRGTHIDNLMRESDTQPWYGHRIRRTKLLLWSGLELLKHNTGWGICSVGFGWVDFDLWCSTILPSSSAVSANFPSGRAEPGRGWSLSTAKIKVKPTQLSEQMHLNVNVGDLKI